MTMHIVSGFCSFVATKASYQCQPRKPFQASSDNKLQVHDNEKSNGVTRSVQTHQDSQILSRSECLVAAAKEAFRKRVFSTVKAVAEEYHTTRFDSVAALACCGHLYIVVVIVRIVIATV